MFFRWVSEAVLRDIDGSLSGFPGASVVPHTGTLPDQCTSNAPGLSVGLPASICDASVSFHRFAFNKPAPSSLIGKNVTFTNAHGTTIVPYVVKATTHAKGWMVLLVNGSHYNMSFVNAEQLTNITYTGVMYDFHVRLVVHVLGRVGCDKIVYMYVCVCVWGGCGWVGRWVGGWTDGCRNGLTDARTDGWMDGWTCVRAYVLTLRL